MDVCINLQIPVLIIVFFSSKHKYYNNLQHTDKRRSGEIAGLNSKQVKFLLKKKNDTKKNLFKIQSRKPNVNY